MLNFRDFLTEQQGAGKNLHLEHIEDEILNFGVDGGRAAINFLRSLRDMLAGSSKSSVNMTVKWDGAPAIFAGKDPSDGQFFVAKKSVFNKTPLLYKSVDEIKNDAKLSDALKTKFTAAFENFKDLGIEGVLQGDLMFTPDDIETDDIDGVSYYTFQPNTIVYAVPVTSEMGKTIKKAKIGVVWHTTYSGDTLEGMKASFGANISKLTRSENVWMDDASYKDASGTATFSATETKEITKVLSDVGRTFRKIESRQLKEFLQLQQSMTGNLEGAKFKTYNNSKVREGQKVANNSLHAKGYTKWVEDAFNKNIAKLKTPAKKQELEKKRDSVVREVRKLERMLANVTEFQGLMIDAKSLIVNKLNSVKQMTSTFIRTDNGFKVTDAEGYVAIDKVKGNAVKLVDRMEFSFNNFTAIKAWDR